MTQDKIMEAAKDDYAYTGKPLEWQRGFDAAWKEATRTKQQPTPSQIWQVAGGTQMTDLSKLRTAGTGGFGGLGGESQPTPSQSVEENTKSTIYYVRYALKKALECNESNGYHSAFDIDLIVEAIDTAMKESKAAGLMG